MIVRETLKEEFFDSPLHQQLAKKAELERHTYKKEQNGYKEDHQQHLSIRERREVLHRVALGLDLSRRNASDFETKLTKLLKEYGL